MAGFDLILITGADGYLGARIAAEYLNQSDKKLILWVRADNEKEFEDKKLRLSSSLGNFGERITFKYGNLKSEHPFHSVNPDNISTIIHCAAVTKFNVDTETAKAVNVDGTHKVMDFATKCSSLKSFNLLSTIYASGLKEGLIEELPFNDSLKFGNQYEKSKWESENLLLQSYNSLPWRILRIATVISDDENGKVTQQNAFHNTLKLFYYGLLSIIPGNPEAPLYFVTGDFCSKSIFEIVVSSPLSTIYHVSPNRSGSISVGELIETAFAEFLKSEDFKKRRILRPIYSDQVAFETLAQGVNALNAGILSQSISSISPFSSQLFLNKNIDNARLLETLKCKTTLNIKSVVEKACAYLVRSKWNRA